MRTVTVYRSGGTFGMVAWKDRDNPTESELQPEGATKKAYLPMPHDFVDSLAKKTSDEVSEILMDYFFKKT